MTLFKSTMNFDPNETVAAKAPETPAIFVDSQRRFPISPPASDKDGPELRMEPSGTSCEDWSGQYSFASVRVSTVFAGAGGTLSNPSPRSITWPEL